MEIETRLVDLSTMQPRLSWNDFQTAAACVLSDGRSSPVSLELIVVDVPGFEEAKLMLRVDWAGIEEGRMERLRRTLDLPRLVEYAAIAIAGLALYHVGGHVIIDVTRRGSRYADYLVGDRKLLL